jgi:ribosomal protein S1
MPRKKTESDSQPSEAVQPEPEVSRAVPEAQAEPPPPEQSVRRRVSEDILQLTEEEVGLTAEDSEDVKWGYLAGAARRGQILTGVVSSIVPSESGNRSCAVEFEGMRVLVPYREMTFREWPANELPPRSVHTFMQRILGATVDFIPAGVDVRNRAAVGSRNAAMLERQKQYYASGKVKPGIRVACRVLAVGNNTMTVEACGVDAEIYARDVSWEWFPDITDKHSTGDLVVAKVMNVKQNEDTGRYSVSLSIKEATENPDKAAFEKLVPRTNYLGVVTGSQHGLFFIRLQDGANAKTRIYHSKEYPSKLDTVCFHVTSLDEKSMVAKGFITRIIKRHDRLR